MIKLFLPSLPTISQRVGSVTKPEISETNERVRHASRYLSANETWNDPVHFGGKPFDPSAVNGEPPRSHPTLPPPRNLGTGLCCPPPPQPPNGRRIVDSIVRNENRAFTWNKVFRCVSLRFSVRETAKGRFANCGGTVLRWEGEFHFRWYSFRSTRSSFRCCLRAPPPTIPLRDKGILLTDKFV